MLLTYDQCEYVRKQYLQYVKGKITLDKINNRLQKYFNTTKDFKEVITECEKYNRGYFNITWEIAGI